MCQVIQIRHSWQDRVLLFHPGMAAEYCSQFICLSVCEHMFGTAGLIFTKFVV